MLLLLSLLCLVLYLLKLAFRRFSLCRQLAWVPGPPALPILGNLLDFCLSSQEDIFEKMTMYKNKYGSIYKIWLGPQPIIMCQDLELLQKILKDDENVKKSDQYEIGKKFLGDGLITAETGNKWKTHRKFLSSSFHMEVYEQLTHQTWEKSLFLANFLRKFEESGEPVDLIEYMQPITFDIAMATSAGLDSNTLEEEDNREFINIVESFSVLVMTSTFIPLLKYNFIYNLTPLKRKEIELISRINQFAEDIIKRRKQILENQTEQEELKNNIKLKQKKIALDNLIELNRINPEDFSDNDVVNEIKTLLFASYDTLSTSTSFTLFLLSHHPEYQKKLVQELDAYVPNYLTEGISVKSLHNLELLDRCLKESMRMFPPGAILGRLLASPIRLARGSLPAGLDVLVNLHSHHRNEQVFPEPDKFDPDRFLPGEADRRDPLSYIPFGAGSRICIGQKQAIIQAKIIICALIKKYHILPFEKVEDLKLIANLVLKSKTGLRVKLRKR